MDIAICDDDKDQTAYLRDIATSWASAEKAHVSITEYPSAETLLFDWSPGKYDVLLLDIQMAGMDGMELAQQVRKSDKRVVIIFATGYDKHMSAGYDVQAMHYLLKPVSDKKLRDCLTRASQTLSTTPRMVVLNTIDGAKRVDTAEIMYAEMFSHYAEVTTLSQTLRLKIKMSDLEELLGEGFFRPHRSYIVGFKYVERVTRNCLLLTTGINIPLSRKLYDTAYRKFIEYNFTGR